MAVMLLGSSPEVGTAQVVPEGFSVLDVSGQLGRNATAFALLPDERILIANQTTGDVQLVINGSLRPTPLVTVPDILWSGEQGLLGIAVDPDFPDSNYVYVFHTRTDSVNRVSRYTVEGDLTDASSDSLSIDSTSRRTVYDIPDEKTYHNGGTLRFGSDKTLYISSGEDNKFEVSQDLTSPLGKILRINRDGSIPPDNPTFYPEPEGKLGEIFAMGFRNPFRFSIDPKTDELFIGDVGPEDVEELNLSHGGENFGWPRYVANELYRAETPLATSDSTFPIHSYPHASGRRAVIALLTYRERESLDDASFPPEYDGVHFFADFFAGPVQYLKPDGNGGWEVVDFATGFSRPVDAAQGADGSMYVLEYGKAVRKIVYRRPSVATEPDQTLPKRSLTLRQNYPNPFSTFTHVTYESGKAGVTSLSIFNVLGERVATLDRGIEQPGLHTIEWDGREYNGLPLPTGAYLYRVTSGGETQSRMMMVVR